MNLKVVWFWVSELLVQIDGFLAQTDRILGMFPLCVGLCSTQERDLRVY